MENTFSRSMQQLTQGGITFFLLPLKTAAILAVHLKIKIMENKKNPGSRDQNASANRADNQDQEIIKDAHTQADKDMEEDAEFTASSPNDDLDEEESARLGEDNNPIT